MLESQDGLHAAMPQLPRALLLCENNLSSDELKLAEVLDFFRIPWKAVRASEINDASLAIAGRSEPCVLSSAPCMAEVLRSVEHSQRPLPCWLLGTSPVYVYGFRDTEPCRQLLRVLTSDSQANIRTLNSSQTVVSITNDVPGMCGPLSGMQVHAEPTKGDLVFDVTRQGEGFRRIIRANNGEVLFAVMYRGGRFYLSACCNTIDIKSYSSKYFDVRKHFWQTVPAVMYLRWAFRDIWCTGLETSACLIVDDPPLKPRYGFLNFRDVLKLMDENNFTTTIAFIPWNWERTEPLPVDLLRKRPDRFSMCVHGCDHTGGEFAARSSAQLNARIKTANQRMELLGQRTSLTHTRAMVFPQGAFSPEAARALKLNDFIAAVNTEVAPSISAKNETTIADLWDVAILKYETFPIFTRRYMTHGIENFAFDGLLGKPCLIVGHHDVFKNHGRDLVEFIAKLNSLKWNLRWRPLGDVINHSFKVRYPNNGTSVIHMFAESLVMENPSTEPRESVLIKKEGDPDCVRAVMVNQTPVDFTWEAGYLRWRVVLSPREKAQVRVLFLDKLDMDASYGGLGYNMKAMVRRYLSEFRDQYLSQSDLVEKSTARIKRLFN